MSRQRNKLESGEFSSLFEFSGKNKDNSEKQCGEK